MIKSFFQSLNDNEVEYLLISGQATVLYGAATFSEDIDIWINPTDTNRINFLKTLQSLHARFYKLTPPLTNDLLKRGHGFHFILPGPDEIYLDVMGQPPRAPDYIEADLQKNVIDSEWGAIPTLGIRHLVEIKKTQRLADYAIISRLVLIELNMIKNCSVEDFDWAVNTIYTLSEMNELFRNFPDAANAVSNNVSLSEFAVTSESNNDIDTDLENNIEELLTKRMLVCQRNDRNYWREIISELKTMRLNNELMINGASIELAE